MIKRTQKTKKITTIQKGTDRLIRSAAKSIFGTRNLSDTTQKVVDVTKGIEGIIIPKVMNE